MSVQAGVSYFDGRPADERLLDKMSCALGEYGPDGKFQYISGSCGLLYMPFHTTRESRSERQPHISCKGNVLTWDGRLDNRDELISQLGDDLTGETSDSAIVSAAYDRWSTGCFPFLLGDWALAIWSPREKTLILARDYIGVRQLYYFISSNEVVWCTRLEPILLSSNCSFKLSDEYIAGYFAIHPE